MRFGEKDQWGKILYQDIRVLTFPMALPSEAVFVRIFFFTHFQVCSVEENYSLEVSNVEPLSEVWCSSSLRTEYPHILFWTFFFLIRDISISPICLCIQSFIYTNVESYLYCRLYSVLLYILTFFSCGYWKLFQLTTVSLWHTPIIVGSYLEGGKG